MKNFYRILAVFVILILFGISAESLAGDHSCRETRKLLSKEADKLRKRCVQYGYDLYSADGTVTHDFKFINVLCLTAEENQMASIVQNGGGVSVNHFRVNRPSFKAAVIAASVPGAPSISHFWIVADEFGYALSAIDKEVKAIKAWSDCKDY